jgi:hypothetical protein
VAQDIDSGTYEPPEEEPVKKSSVLAGLDNMWNRTKKLVVRDTEAEHAPIEELIINDGDDDIISKQAERAWKTQNPDKTLKRQRQLFEAGIIKQLPWEDPTFQVGVLDEMKLKADNVPSGHTGEVRGFGTNFPTSANKGDMFLRVDRLPSVLFKFKGQTWIEVDKGLSDNHAYDDAYIDHLIAKIGSGEYDPDLLSDAERDRIEEKLKKTSSI